MVSFSFISENRIFIYGDEITEVGWMHNGKDLVRGLRFKGQEIYIEEYLNIDIKNKISESLLVKEIRRVEGGYVIELQKETNNVTWRVNNQNIIMN